ncbi:hypothetical protein LOTGIDRAFT_157150 [Lottia gigantea]|uniref:Uncharacterized protein n=1 Tax=Lottia gigantea TaxID=225164 RepID=V4AWW8_LOTGI|nr:hypothetical protein LOTGIDRAFT_157150 [Lottia gigantea]ESP02018.1 hypothetical protein LOTGIDRAFT_157150 [Lottia gigantea]
METLNDSLLNGNSWPQFTDCFQQTILVWVPLIWLVLITPIYAYYLYTLKVFPTVPVNSLNISKMFLGLSLSLLSLFELLYSISEKNGNNSQSEIVAKGIQVISFQNYAEGE